MILVKLRYLIRSDHRCVNHRFLLEIFKNFRPTQKLTKKSMKVGLFRLSLEKTV